MSVRAKLLNIRDSEPGTDYMQVLLRYIQERMLYRLSMSQYRDNFCLKGSALLFAYEKFKARPTKDFYDVYSILSSESENLKVNEDILTEATTSVFSNRGTTYTENHPLFNGEFKDDPIKQTQWNAFLKKMKFKGVLPLNEVVDYITEKLYPYWLSLKK